MGKIKFAVDKAAFDSAGFAEPPKPGVYTAKIAEINAGFSKGEDGKPDPQRPRLEVIWEITDKRYKGARIWDYVTFGTNTQWKLAQFLNALGLGSKDNVSGEFDTKKLAPKGTDIGKTGKPIAWTSSGSAEARLRVRAGTNQSGEYRAEVGAILPMADEDEDAVDEFGDDAETEEETEEKEEVEEVEDDGEFEDDGEAEEVEEVTIYDADELKAMAPADIKELATYWEIDFKGKKKSEVIAAIAKAQDDFTSEAAAEDDDDMPF